MHARMHTARAARWATVENREAHRAPDVSTVSWTHTHTASSKRSSSASSVPASLPRAESQRPSGFLEQVLPISGGVMASLGESKPWCSSTMAAP